MSDAKGLSTPISNHFTLSIAYCLEAEIDIAEVKMIQFASVVRYLMYVSIKGLLLLTR